MKEGENDYRNRQPSDPEQRKPRLTEDLGKPLMEHLKFFMGYPDDERDDIPFGTKRPCDKSQTREMPRGRLDLQDIREQAKCKEPGSNG